MTITTVNQLDKIERAAVMNPWRMVVVTSGNRGSHSMARNQFRQAAWYLSVLLLSTLWASPLAAQANEPTTAPPAQTTPPAPARPAHSTRRTVTLDDRVKAFAKALDLNESQQAAVKKILEQRQVEMLRIRQDTSIDGSDRIGKFRALQDQTVQRIRAVLNDDQKKKYDPLAIRNREPAPDQKSVEDWLKATTPK